ncbi:imelysin family protein [Oceanisphaera sp. KMM 10153]|uniref:imelysin family protein n=1 Tax=Oceanisphaera submarina TaxID=3390193 RepID=UPI0039757AEA
MKKSLLLLATLGTLTACQSQPPVDSALQTLADHHLTFMRQQAVRLAGELDRLQQAGADYCLPPSSAPPQESLAGLKQHWRSSFAAWSAHQGQSGGPLDAEGLSFAFQFWPDKKDTTGKQLQRQLTAAEQDKPIQYQGATTTLGAMEYLLESDLTPSQRCLLVPEIGTRLAANGRQLSAAWHDVDGYQQQLALMRQQGGTTALLTQILGQLAHRYDRIEKKLVLPLNTVEHPRPLFAEAWRSGQSLHFMRTSLISLEQEYRHGGIRTYLQDSQQQDPGHAAVITALDHAFADTLEHLPAGDSLGYWLEGDRYAALLRFKLSFDQLGYQLKQRLPGDLGLNLGFNATDGD